jgi:hypothetical protein
MFVCVLSYLLLLVASPSFNSLDRIGWALHYSFIWSWSVNIFLASLPVLLVGCSVKARLIRSLHLTPPVAKANDPNFYGSSTSTAYCVMQPLIRPTCTSSSFGDSDTPHPSCCKSPSSDLTCCPPFIRRGCFPAIRPRTGHGIYGHERRRGADDGTQPNACEWDAPDGRGEHTGGAP